MRLLFLLFIFISIYSSCPSQERYFYNGRDFGSEALYNPLNLILNGSYDIIQMDASNRKIFIFPYKDAAKNVIKNLSSPLGPISRYGWANFLSNEVFPVEIAKKGAQWWPNYQLHLIGGGMTYSAMREWYDYHGFPYPSLFSITTLSAYHLLNEIVENGSYQGDNVDPISDIYLFDAGGIILFSFDNVNKFFKEKLNLADWSLQPSFNLSDGSLQNNGQYFSIKWKIPYLDKWHLFYYFGMNGLTGLSYKFENGTALSLGAGLRAKKRYVLNESTNQMTVDMVWNAGLFYDKDNSLMTSLFVSGLTDYRINLNIYPGIIKFWNFSPGLWGVMKADGKVMFGISTMYTPGIGF